MAKNEIVTAEIAKSRDFRSATRTAKTVTEIISRAAFQICDPQRMRIAHIFSLLRTSIEWVFARR